MFKDVDQVEFINDFGQTINPGDKVITYIQGKYNSDHFLECTYIGIDKRTSKIRVVYELSNKLYDLEANCFVKDPNGEFVYEKSTHKKLIERQRIYKVNTHSPIGNRR